MKVKEKFAKNNLSKRLEPEKTGGSSSQASVCSVNYSWILVQFRSESVVFFYQLKKIVKRKWCLPKKLMKLISPEDTFFYLVSEWDEFLSSILLLSPFPSQISDFWPVWDRIRNIDPYPQSYWIRVQFPVDPEPQHSFDVLKNVHGYLIINFSGESKVTKTKRFWWRKY